MKIERLTIHNFRSIKDASIEVHDYTMVVGANNAGKSNLLAGLRAFYEDIKWTPDDQPKFGDAVEESWVEVSFALTEDEWTGLAAKYQAGPPRQLVVRRYFVSRERVKANQSNIYGVVNGEVDKDLFYGAKNIGTAKVGKAIYIPAFTTAADQMKTTGPSPLRDMLNFMLKRVVSESPAYKMIEEAFGQLNAEAKGERGFLSQIAGPINEAIAHWGIRFDMDVNSISPDDITKSLVKHAFADAMLGDAAFALDRYGHGFQRSFLYELIKLAPTFGSEPKLGDKKEFDPELTVILFEEPEAFLHPAQQENMAYHLRRLSTGASQQVIITSHSSIFVGKAADDLCQVVRARRINGVTELGQIRRDAIQAVFAEGLDFRTCLQAFVDDPTIADNQKAQARTLLAAGHLDADAAASEEKFRYQLWLDSERSSMFFADRVLLVEGATEKALFCWLLAREWHELTRYRIAVVDVMGKFNFHRYMALLEAFGIPYGLILDDDHEKQHHAAVNDMLRHRAGVHRLAAPEFVAHCMETFLGAQLPGRDDLKPVNILSALTNNEIAGERLAALQTTFQRALAL